MLVIRFRHSPGVTKEGASQLQGGGGCNVQAGGLIIYCNVLYK